MGSIARKFGMIAETLRIWVRRAEVDGGKRPGVKSEEDRVPNATRFRDRPGKAEASNEAWAVEPGPYNRSRSSLNRRRFRSPQCRAPRPHTVAVR
jgi:transposase-like protein